MAGRAHLGRGERRIFAYSHADDEKWILRFGAPLDSVFGTQNTVRGFFFWFGSPFGSYSLTAAEWVGLRSAPR